LSREAGKQATNRLRAPNSGSKALQLRHIRVTHSVRQTSSQAFIHSFDLITFEAPRVTHFIQNDLLKFQTQQQRH